MTELTRQDLETIIGWADRVDDEYCATTHQLDPQRHDWSGCPLQTETYAKLAALLQQEHQP